jgi:hypothetical protein
MALPSTWQYKIERDFLTSDEDHISRKGFSEVESVYGSGNRERTYRIPGALD